jgi:hypothetical protein
MGMWFGTWNVRRLYRAGFLMMVSKEVSKYKLDLMRVQEIRRDRDGIEQVVKCAFFFGKGMRIMN